MESLLIALENILDNQVRYANKEINIRITKDHEIVISNDGSHFVTKNPEDLFESHRKDQHGNFGLGLAIVKRVVVIHGGEIKAMKTDEGVRFSIDFHKLR